MIRNDDFINSFAFGICLNPAHQDDYDQLGACLICRVPTINGLHPTARARLLEKRPDLARIVQ